MIYATHRDKAWDKKEPCISKVVIWHAVYGIKHAHGGAFCFVLISTIRKVLSKHDPNMPRYLVMC